MASKKTRFSTMLYFEQSETSDFQQIVSRPTFIDKTLLIKHLLESNSYHWIITSPPGYGKSTNLDMIKRFVEIPIDENTGKVYVFWKSKNYKIFKKCKLFCNWELSFHLHGGSYSVIHLSLKDVYGTSMKTLMEKFAITLCHTFKRHRYLKRSTILTKKEKKQLSRYNSLKACRKLTAIEIENGIVFLAEMLARHLLNRNVYVLIDDYDYPVTRFLQDTSDITHKFDFFRFFDRIFDSILRVEPKKFIIRSLFTGVIPIELKLFVSHIESAKLECHVFPFADSIDDFYGITREEIIDLLQRYDSYDAVTEEDILYFYGSLLSDEKPIVNTHCCLRFLSTRKCDDFYHFDNIFNYLGTILNDHKIRYLFERLLTLDWITFMEPLSVRPDDFISIREAYLKVTSTSRNFRVFFVCLMHYGFFDAEVSCEIGLHIRIANTFLKNKLRLAIGIYYGDELNEKLEKCAETFQKLFFLDSSSDSCANFLMQYREILILYSRKFPWVEFVGFQCILDIVAKCETHIVTEVQYLCNWNPEEHYLILCHNVNLDFDDSFIMNVILIHITYQSIITATLADTFDNDSLYQGVDYIPENFDIDSTIHIGINTDENFKCSMGLVIDDNTLDNARYYSCPNQN